VKTAATLSRRSGAARDGTAWEAIAAPAKPLAA
jgi:hypothetical protein